MVCLLAADRGARLVPARSPMHVQSGHTYHRAPCERTRRSTPTWPHCRPTIVRCCNDYGSSARVVPEAVETISYGMPAFKVGGRFLLSYAG